MKKTGFTLVELITTFSLSAVIIFFLINIILIIKDNYYKSDVETNLYINQSTLSNLINKKIYNNQLVSYSACDTEKFCYIFTYLNGETSKLTINDSKIVFDEYVYKLNNNTVVTNPNINKINLETADSSSNDSFLVIDIPINNPLFNNKNFGIKVVYMYNSNILSL